MVEQVTTLLSPLPSRLAHVLGVGARARWVSAALDEPDRPDLFAAAYLHDIGYAPAQSEPHLAVVAARTEPRLRWLGRLTR